MGKLMKQEYKNTRTIVIVAGLVFYIGLFIYFINLMQKYQLNIKGTPEVLNTMFLIFMLGMSMYFISSFKRDIDGEQSYLVFTLPVKGRKIVICKLIMNTIYFIILMTGFILCKIAIFNYLDKNQLVILISDIKSDLIVNNYKYMYIFIMVQMIAYLSILVSKIIGARRANKSKETRWSISWIIIYTINLLIFIKFYNWVSYDLNFLDSWTKMAGYLNSLGLFSLTTTWNIVTIVHKLPAILLFVGILLLIFYLLEEKIEII